MKFLGTVLGLLGVAGQALAGGCGYSYRPTYYAPTKYIYVTEYVDRALYIPVGFATYSPVVAAPAAALLNLTPVVPAAPVALPVPQANLPVVPGIPVVPGAAAPLPAPGAAAPADRLLAELQKINARLDALESKRPELMAAPLAKGTKLAACMKCHTPAVAEKAGGGHVFFDAEGNCTMTERQALLGFKRVLKGDMPPNEKLSDEQGKGILELLDQHKEAKK